MVRQRAGALPAGRGGLSPVMGDDSLVVVGLLSAGGEVGSVVRSGGGSPFAADDKGRGGGPCWLAGRLSPLPVAAHRGDGRVRAAFQTRLHPWQAGKPRHRGGKGMLGRGRGVLSEPLARNRGSELLEKAPWKG